MTPSERFEILNKFIGYGDLEQAQLFFLGLEEGGLPWTRSEEDDRKITRRATPPYLTRDKWDEDNSDWRDYFKITNRMQTYLATTLRRAVNYVPACDLEIRRYFFEEFGSAFEFQTNFFPLACPKLSIWPQEYPKLFFGDRSLKKEEYYSECIQSDRAEVIRRLVRTVRDSRVQKYMVVMGYALWDVLQERVFMPECIFFPRDRSWKRGGKSTGLSIVTKWSEDKRFWLCGHPNGGWFSKAVADFIVDEIRNG